MPFTVRDVMTPDYPTARAEESVVAAVKQMVQTRFGAIPIVEDGGVCRGVLGSWDVARLIAQDRDLHSTSAGSVVQGGLTLEPETSIERAMAITSGEGTPLVPVIDGGSLAGIVTMSDFEAHRRLRDLLGAHMDELVTEIAPNDQMLYGPRGLYFVGGAVALASIHDAMQAGGRATAQRILDIPCGHGRVMRTLKAAFPDAHLTACDLNEDGVDFCARVFGAEPAYAPLHPRDLAIDGLFDLIWVGSLFTHLDRERWMALLDALESLLMPGGLLVFTTLAQQSTTALRGFNLTDQEIADLQETLERDGFAYCAFSAPHENWGLTLNSEEFVRAQIAERPSLRLVHFTERAWAPPKPGQDVFACLKGDD